MERTKLSSILPSPCAMKNSTSTAYSSSTRISRQRKQYEQDLIHSNELIERAFNSIDIMIAYMDRQFNFIRVNEAYASSAGHPVDYFTGKNHFALYPHAENQAIFQRVVDTGEPYSVFEKPFENPEYPGTGATYWNWRLQPVSCGAGGAVQGVVLSLVDVTERKLAELQLERQRNELQALSISEHKQRQLAETLNAVSLALSQTLSLETVMDTLMDYARRLVPARARLYLDRRERIGPDSAGNAGCRKLRNLKLTRMALLMPGEIPLLAGSHLHKEEPADPGYSRLSRLDALSSLAKSFATGWASQC